MDSLGEIIIYTDGAALGNPGPGGYGAVLMFQGKGKEIAEGYKHTTNNRMELLAVIKALQLIKQPGYKVEIYTDSKYVRDAIELGWLWNWQKKGWVKVKNPDLWKALIPLYQLHKPRLHWVKGHAGNVWNERCDELATSAAKSNPTKEDLGYLEILKNDPTLFE